MFLVRPFEHPRLPRRSRAKAGDRSPRDRTRRGRPGTILPWLFLVAAPAVVLAEQLPTIVFSARDGVATTPAKIVVDSKGFVWFPSCEGLARFDGNGFRVFTPADGLPGDCTLDIVERRDGTYWVAAREHLCLFDPAPNRKRFQCEFPKLGTINTLLENEQGLWCGTDSGLWRRAVNGSTWEFIRAIEASAAGRSIAVSRLLKDTRGDVWAATHSGLYRFRANGRVDRWTRAQGLADDLITGISEAAGAIWVGTTTELMRFQVDRETGDARIAGRYDRSDGLPGTQRFDVRAWRGRVWAATFQGLARQLPSGRWEAVEMDPSVRGFPLQRLATDNLGNLWVGTDGGGAARISGSGLSSFSERDGLAVPKVWAIFEDRNGNLMTVAKDEDHYSLNRFDGYRFHPIRPSSPFGIPWGWSWSQIVAHSRSGDWWVATGSGLLRYRNSLDAAPTVQGPAVGLRLGNIFQVFEDSRGGIWASVVESAGSGLHRRDPATGRFESFDQSHGLPVLHQGRNYPFAFAEDRAGHIWIGMLDGGLVRFRDRTFQQFPSSAGGPDEGVRALLVDRQGRLWIGARRRGLLRVDNPSAAHPVFIPYTKSSGLSSITIVALAEDLAGRIYAASGRGIDRLDPATGRIRHFTTADGLLPGELRVGFRDRHGALWFGGDHGLIRIEPQEDRAEPPEVLVHSIRVNGETRPVSDVGEAEPAALSLSASQRQLQVDFGGFRHDLLYQTLLSGVDRDWTPPSSSRSVHYLSLAPGSYQLAIRAVTPEDSSSSKPALVRFRIAAPVWRRWWFLLLSVAGVAAMAYTGHRYRLAQAVALERVRSRIAADLHDGVGANLSRIALLSEVVRRQVEPVLPDAIPALSAIAENARDVIDDVSDAVWMIDPRLDSLQEVVVRVRAVASDLFDGQPVAWTLDAADDLSSVALAPEQRRHVYLIVKESLTNVLRHAQAAHVVVRIAASDGRLRFDVADDGIGVDAAGRRPKAGGGHGLANMRTRAAALGGTLTVASGAGTRGTRVTLEIPMRRPA